MPCTCLRLFGLFRHCAWSNALSSATGALGKKNFSSWKENKTASTIKLEVDVHVITAVPQRSVRISLQPILQDRHIVSKFQLQEAFQEAMEDSMSSSTKVHFLPLVPESCPSRWTVLANPLPTPPTRTVLGRLIGLRPLLEAAQPASILQF